MRIPVEILQQIFTTLLPIDFNDARHTCRLWFFASLDRSLLTLMLKRGGWWSSVLRIISSMDNMFCPSVSHEALMSRWLARECNLANGKSRAFIRIGRTDLRNLARADASDYVTGALSFTVSQCGRFLIAAHDKRVCVYELNHGRRKEVTADVVCLSSTERVRHMPIGVLRPVTSIECPGKVLACSMDTSSGRCTIAILMDGRMGMVCDVSSARLALSKCASPLTSVSSSGSSSPVIEDLSQHVCVCCNPSATRSMPPEEGQRAIYRNLCHADDPPRSVAICAQRDCVVFGCSAGIELHWVDAISGQDFSRWFPLVSPSDFLYFLPARRGVDTAKKLRLISSAAECDSFHASSSRQFHGYSTSLLRSGTTAVVSFINETEDSRSTHSGRVIMLPAQISVTRNIHSHNLSIDANDFIRRVSARTAEHYRAIPISDGYHILFTDPCTGHLGMGTDAPVGSMTRLFRKVWFRPPGFICSSTPILYAAARNLQDGVRVVATFELTAAEGASSSKIEQANRQAIVFYTVPPDLFLRESFSEPVIDRPTQQLRVQTHSRKLISYGYNADDAGLQWPLEIDGQVVGTGSNITEIGIDSESDVIIWSFTADGLGMCWAVNTGEFQSVQQMVLESDGSWTDAER